MFNNATPSLPPRLTNKLQPAGTICCTVWFAPASQTSSFTDCQPRSPSHSPSYSDAAHSGCSCVAECLASRKTLIKITLSFCPSWPCRMPLLSTLPGDFRLPLFLTGHLRSPATSSAAIMQQSASETRASLLAEQLPDPHLGTQSASSPPAQPASGLTQASLFSTPIRLEPQDTSIIAHSHN